MLLYSEFTASFFAVKHTFVSKKKMNQLNAFYELKQRVLLRYREEYSYVSADWKSFSSKDILQLIDSIEEATKQRISEKWIYSHLKPAENEKLPRKDMLDILCNYCRIDSWDAFIHDLTPLTLEKTERKRNKKPVWITFFGLVLVAGIFLTKKFWSEPTEKKEEVVSVKDFYTQEEITDTTIQLNIKGKDSSFTIKNIPPEVWEKKLEIEIESPFYSEAIVMKKDEEKTVVLKPDDYAMMLKAFIQSDIKDWEMRRNQLNKILSEDLEVLIHLQNSMGIEYMNKEEFAQKLTIPTKAIKQWQVLSLEQDESNKIVKIRIKQN